MGRVGPVERSLLDQFQLFTLCSTSDCSIPLASFHSWNGAFFTTANLRVSIMIKQIFLIMSCTLLTACLAANLGKNKLSNQYQKQAKLINYTFDDRFVHIEVLSYGCTFITSFELVLVDKVNNSIEVIRKKPDNCKVAPIKISLDYTFRHLGVDSSRPINIVNPLITRELASMQ